MALFAGRAAALPAIRSAALVGAPVAARPAAPARLRRSGRRGVSGSAAAAEQPPPPPQQQQQQQAPVDGMPEGPQQVNVPMPIGPMEPEPEAPKRLSPHARLSEDLNSTSIVIVGSDTELNWAVCQALSKKIGWFGVSTGKILAGMHKADSVQQLLEREGAGAVAAAEAKVLAGMRDQLRCCVATLGGGATAQPGTWPNLFGSIIIHLEEQDRRGPKQQPQQAQGGGGAAALCRQHAEVKAVIQGGSGGGFGDKPLSADDKAQRAASQLVKAVLKLLKQDGSLLARKRAYVQMGCRGDWPALQPPEWNPVLEGLRGERRPPAGGEPAAAASSSSSSSSKGPGEPQQAA